MMKYIKFFKELNINDIETVGGKNASLGEMYQKLSKEWINIPNGFATTSDAYWLMLEKNNIKEKIKKILDLLDAEDTESLQQTGTAIRELILNSQIPKELESEILEAYKILSKSYNSESLDVAIRSSGTAEDLPDASFAGQQESFLNINTPQEVLLKVKACFASLFTDRAISYRASRGFEHFKVALSVGVQKMVRSDKASSGIIFTIDTHSGTDTLVLINSLWGLGENIVSGRVNGDEFLVFKPTLKEGKKAILKRSMGSKKQKMLYGADGSSTLNTDTTKEEQESFSISDEEVEALAKIALKIEEHYKRPMDIEWAKDALDGKLYIVQARPETVESKKRNSMSIEKYSIDAKDAKVLTHGKAVGQKIGSGNVRVIRDKSEFPRFKKGDVLVANTTNPDWEPVMKIASAVVTNSGSRTCHAAIVAREIGVVAVVGCVDATDVLKDDEVVTVSCVDGDEGFVYDGKIPFTIIKQDISNFEKTKTKLFMNVADPKKAFTLAKMPNDGVGLARMEFIITNYINEHPMSLVKKGKSAKEFFVSKLSEGISEIAAAFYPKPVIVRTSDFKSNEYKNMPGGAEFEIYEENPMIGFRGASRYYDDAYREAFEMECEALKYVRNDMGLTNVVVMLPFVRTPQEGKKVIEVMNKKGLIQGVNGLKVYAMCEIPANVILADKFLEVFDGYSIGSNDLTQLTLGVDRDSAKIAHLFDERNEAVLRMLKMAIEACKKADKYIGICGQAPSDYPEITEFLVKNGIDSISLNPDSLFKMHEVVTTLELNI